MANTYSLIEAKTLASAAASVTFSSIPQTYTDIKFLLSLRSTPADVRDSLYIKPNNSTSNLTYRYIRSDGSAVSSNTLDRVDIAAANATASTFGNLEIYIPNYASANYKSFSIDTVTENNSAEAYAGLHAWLWSDVTAISSMVFANASAANFVANSTFYLYGIKNS